MKKGIKKAKGKVKDLFNSIGREGSHLHSLDADPEPVPPAFVSSRTRVVTEPETQHPAVVITQSTPIVLPVQITAAMSSMPSDPDQIPPTPPVIHRSYTEPQAPQATSVNTSYAPLEASRLPSSVSEHHVLTILNNNQNTTYNYGRDVVNNNSVNNSVDNSITNNYYLTNEEENILKEIKTVIGNRFIPAALHDTQPDEAGCMTGTRVRILSIFLEWAKSDPMRIFWLAGLAGTGKTSIAVTLCRMLQEEPDVLLGGAFFCSRTANMKDLTDARCIIPTLAASLAARSREFAAALKRELDADPIAISKPISVQIGALLQRPLAALNPAPRPIIFVVDALDECSDENDVKRLLQAISTLQSDVRLKFIVTSRPETHIRTSPIASTNRSNILKLHTINNAEVTEDIRMYIASAFSEEPLEEVWYTQSDVNLLATSAYGLFIFASTVVTYVLDTDSVDDRKARLDIATRAMKESEVATAPLDAVYEFVLTRASSRAKVEAKELEATRQVLASIMSARMPLSVAALADLLGQRTDSLRASLRRLHAIMHVPDDSDQPGLRTVHASFGDYLFDRATAGLRISRTLGEELLARGCLQIMRKQLHFNVSQSRSSHEQNSPSKPDSITLSLKYACLQWVYHLADLQQPQMLDSEIDDSFCPNFLFWLEVMSILGQVPRSTAMLFIAIAKVESTELRRFMSDGSAFVVSSQKAIERSAPHIYLSALPLVPEQSLIHKYFVPFCAGLVSINAFGIDRPIGSTSVMLTGHTNVVEAVVYAPDGRLISCSRDGTVRIWDTRTGEEMVAFVCSGYGYARCVDVAPGGTSIVAGTWEGAVFVWDLQAPQQSSRTLLGHSGVVLSVAFSPCGNLITSSSLSGELALWRAKTAKEISVISQDSSGVYAVIFSPDGGILASGRRNGKVGLWNGRTGLPAAVSTLHNDSDVSSLSFTSDGKILAAGLNDSSIVLWEMPSTTKIATLRTNTSRIRSLQFSPDGTSLLCCSCMNDFELYNIHRDAINSSPAVFVGHSGWVNCARFSPDGLHIASASFDHTIRIWNVGDGKRASRTPRTHPDFIRSVHVSADGTSIVSSHVRSVHVWDLQTGELKLSPTMGNKYEVVAVAMFPRDRFMMDPPWNHTVRLLDLHTGMDLHGPPRSDTRDTLAIMIKSDDSHYSFIGQSVKIWDVAAQQSSSILPPCQGDVKSIAVSPDGRLIAAWDDEKHIHVWSSDTGKPVCAPFENSKMDGWPFGMAISHSGTRIACSRDRKIGDVLEIGTGNRVYTLEGHSGPIWTIAFAPNGVRIATCSEDGTVRLWDAATGAQLAVLHGHGSDVRSVAFTPDGRFIVSGGYDSTIRVWDVEEALTRSTSSSSDHTTALEYTGFKDGWVLGPTGELLLWVPIEYRDYITGPSCRVFISDRRVSISTPEVWHHGANWTACWCGPTTL